MDENIHEIIYEWLMGYEPLTDWYFNFNNAKCEAVSVIPIPSNTFTTEYIDGSGVVFYDFQINIFKTISKVPHIFSRRNQNAANLFDVQAFMKWIQDQFESGNLPDIGHEIESIDVLQNIPTTAGQDDSLYMLSFPGRIQYIKEA